MGHQAAAHSGIEAIQAGLWGLERRRLFESQSQVGKFTLCGMNKRERKLVLGASMGS
jgi:hypothetical protein